MLSHRVKSCRECVAGPTLPAI